MILDPGTTVAIVTLGSLGIGAILKIIVMLLKRSSPWEKELAELKSLISNHISDNKVEFTKIEAKLKLLNLDSDKIDEVKIYIDKIEDSIGKETSKLEQKIEDLMKLVIQNMRK